MALPLISQSAALAGQVGNTSVECELPNQPDHGWYEQSMVGLQTVVTHIDKVPFVSSKNITFRYIRLEIPVTCI